jgi:nicotinate-nucleotide--dimethylbenzimidazole phosphoribosyltransferase
MTLAWIDHAIRQPDTASMEAATERQAMLTKPPGALGRLEALAVRLAGLLGTERPDIAKMAICVFAGDHGVAARGVSAFPQAVTAEMVKNFARGGAAISVLAALHGARLEIVNLGTLGDTSGVPGVRNLDLGKGTRDFTAEPAMTAGQLALALEAGRDAVGNVDLFIGGEMGIGNTTSATALACALLNLPASVLAGPGTGLDGDGVVRKIQVIRQALDFHPQVADEPLEVLRRLGGFEIAALVGAYIHCGQRGVPVLVDGFISTVAALLATRLQPVLADWLLYAHRSAEPGHRRVLDALQAEPLLDLDMRLGEGSGAAVALPILQQACALHNGMATFAEAAVSSVSE